MKIKHINFILIMLILSLCGACKSNPSKFYMLRPIPELTSELNSYDQDDMVIGVGPITIPEYLDRPQIVAQNSDNEIVISEFNRWGEPLENNASRVISENLSKLLSTENIIEFPWNRETSVNYQIAIQIKKLNSFPGKNVQFEALWSIKSIADNKELLKKRFKSIEVIDSDNFEEIVNIKSKLFADLCREISDSMTSLSISNHVSQLDARHD